MILTNEVRAELKSQAIATTKRSRAPYSGLRVGAAALLSNGDVVTGCNVECASYGLTLCAECGIVSAAQLVPDTHLVAVSIVDQTEAFLAPCGRCRQLLLEVGGPDLLIDADPEPVRIDELLPGAFTSSELHERSDDV